MSRDSASFQVGHLCQHEARPAASDRECVTCGLLPGNTCRIVLNFVRNKLAELNSKNVNYIIISYNMFILINMTKYDFPRNARDAS